MAPDPLASLETKLVGGLGINIGPGWLDLVLELDRQLTELFPNYRIHQIKEKFGGLRYYVDIPWSQDSKAYALIGKAETESFKICEWCGKPGSVGRQNSWRIVTRCEECGKSEE